MTSWKLRAGFKTDVVGVDLPHHPTITESTTGVEACGDSWCDGRCGLPALVLTHKNKVHRAFGAMVAMGPVFQAFRTPWAGTQIEVTLTEDLPVEQALKLFWM